MTTRRIKICTNDQWLIDIADLTCKAYVDCRRCIYFKKVYPDCLFALRDEVKKRGITFVADAKPSTLDEG